MAVETGALALQRYSVKSARMLPPLEEFDRLSWRSSSALLVELARVAHRMDKTIYPIAETRDIRTLGESLNGSRSPGRKSNHPEC